MTTLPPPPPPLPLPPPPPKPLAALLMPPPPPIPLKRPTLAMDTEVYINFWSIGFMDATTREVVAEFESYPGHPLDVAGVARWMQAGEIVSYNGRNYDDPMITLALTGASNEVLKLASDAIIKDNLKPWLFEAQFGVKIPQHWDCIDLIEVAPGIASLKIRGGRMHSKKMQDLPIEPSATITPEQREELRTYRNNDLETTVDLYWQLKPQLDLRAVMSREYGTDLRSKSDAQIAEAVIKARLGRYIEKPRIPPGTQYRYQVPDFIAFHTPAMQDVLQMVKGAVFVISAKDQLLMPKELETRKIAVGSSVYQMGIGGLHSTEAAVCHIAADDEVMFDIDVTGYYPDIIRRLGLFPRQIGPQFLQVYGAIVDRRVEAKHAGDKVVADSLKIVVNGSFGKFGSKYSILYSPDLMLQTTVTGQLSLLMLIEAMELCGMHVVSANTDGIVVKCKRHMLWMRDQLVADWENRTSFKMEETRYAALYSANVNNYIAMKLGFDKATKQWTNEVVGAKTKGWYADAALAKNPIAAVSVEAVIAFLQHGTPIADTVRSCTDIRKFVIVRSVTGGAEKLHGDEIQAATSQKGMREQLEQARWEPDFESKNYTYGGSAYMPLAEAHAVAIQQLRNVAPVRRTYLGKAVRWYYAAGEPGSIRYVTNGNLVPRTDEGAKPLMDLPDTFPTDVDYTWYITEACGHLTDMGVK